MQAFYVITDALLKALDFLIIKFYDFTPQKNEPSD